MEDKEKYHIQLYHYKPNHYHNHCTMLSYPKTLYNVHQISCNLLCVEVFCNVYQQWFPNGNASVFAGYMFDAFDSNKVSDQKYSVFILNNSKMYFHTGKSSQMLQ